MFPHERSLVKRYKDQPFVLLGVNEDGQHRDRAREFERDGQVTWRSWWDPGTEGKIATTLEVNRLPTLFLIDPVGKIRKRWKGPPNEGELEREIDKLLKEVEAGKES